eukprot:366525-Chlamydomonas_euryale.AAC.5
MKVRENDGDRCFAIAASVHGPPARRARPRARAVPTRAFVIPPQFVSTEITNPANAKLLRATVVFVGSVLLFRWVDEEGRVENACST